MVRLRFLGSKLNQSMARTAFYARTYLCLEFKVSVFFSLQATVHKQPAAQAQQQQVEQPVHYGRRNQEEDDSREY